MLREYFQPKMLSAILCVACIYFIVGWVGIHFAALDGASLTLIWLPAGVGLSSALIFGHRIWPAIWIGSFAANTPYLNDPNSSFPLFKQLFFGAGAATVNATVQTLLAYYLYRHVIGEGGFKNRLDVLRFVFIVILIPSLLNPTLLVPFYSLGGFVPTNLDSIIPYFQWETWSSIFLADFHGFFIITPLVIAWHLGKAIPTAKVIGGHLILFLAPPVFIALLLISYFHFTPAIYLLIALGVWISMGYGLRGATIFTFALSISLIIATTNNHSVFSDPNSWYSFISLMVFVFSVSLPMLLLGSQEVEIRLAQTDLESQVAARTEELSRANTAKDNFLTNISHELRTPLHSIFGLTRLIRSESKETEAVERTKLIDSAGQSLLVQINTILNFAHMNNSELLARHTKFNLHESIIELKNQLNSQAVAIGTSIDLEISDQVPEFVLSDRERLNQILRNLLSNAVKYGQASPISLKIFPAEMDTELNFYTFSVEDKGPGIPLDEQAAIFDPFHRLTETENTSFGTGLGLSISKQLTESLGGKLTVHSNGFSGSRFELTLPLTRTYEVIGDPSNSSRKSILLVEDEIIGTIIARETLQSLGHEVITVSSAEEALEKLEEHNFDIIITDLELPNISGIDFIEKAKAENKLPDQCNIIALTANAMAPSTIRANLFDKILIKPLTEDMFTQAISQNNPTKESYDYIDIDFLAGELKTLGNAKITDLIDLYKQESKHKLDLLKKHIETENREETAKLVHQFASMASNLGLNNLYQECAAIEVKLKNNTQQNLTDLFEFDILSHLTKINTQSMNELDMYLSQQ